MVKYDYTYQLGTNEGSSATASNQYIILHDTGNANNAGTNSAQNEASYMHGHWGNAYTHAIAGWDRVYIIGEPGYVAYGAGSPANERSPFQIELARYADHAKAISAYKNWVAAAVEHAKKYGIPLTLDGAGNGIKSHKWVSDNLWGDHQDPYGYLSSIGISKAQLAADLKNGAGSVPTTSTPVPKQVLAKPVTAKGSVLTNVNYDLHQLNGTWLGEVTNFSSDPVNGFAGNPNHAHDALVMKVSHGSVKYRVHTVQDGWLPVVRDDTGFAGMLGEPLDRLQIKIGTANPF
ncbi:N-acetylmuramoyl-L-alanine amidase [Lacticaseibacillus sp. N501-2]|uniref:N-acetylmuramoyl-L-alanine amidase n=1 Tax=Lacticaseibacillus salsurae TaxID=3367729 RepID=UPI0038B367EC